MKLIVLLSIDLLICFTGPSRSLSNRGFVEDGVLIHGFKEYKTGGKRVESQRDAGAEYLSINNAAKKRITFMRSRLVYA